MEHTQGKWKNDNTGEYYNGHWIRMNGVLIAKISHQKGGKSKGEPEANARLIAAAPDLLEALKEIAEGKGAYNEDPLIHAANTIECLKLVAKIEIAKADLSIVDKS